MKVLGVIPARYASSRFPGKPLAMIGERSMIQAVYEQSLKCSALHRVIVATDDERIFSHVLSFGGEVMMTSERHQSGTDRIGEVIGQTGQDYDVVVNIQGDEPLLDPLQIDKVIQCFFKPDVQIATLKKEISSTDELFNPNVVKVVTAADGTALYFSRFPIPFVRSQPESDWLHSAKHFKHLGLYAFRSDILKELVLLKGSSLESAESLEQLRWLENGYRIKVVITDIETIAIDTPEDLLKLTNKI